MEIKKVPSEGHPRKVNQRLNIQLVWAVMPVGLLIFLGVASLRPAVSRTPTEDSVSYVFGSLGLLVIAGGAIFRHLISKNTNLSTAARFQRTILAATLIEAGGIFGFVLLSAGGVKSIAYALFGLALLCFLAFRPTREELAAFDLNPKPSPFS